MEIRNLTTFVRIAEVQSFSHTAAELGYSQSAVTMQIKQLEEELGTPLFERIGRKVKLTQAGERLLPHALSILDSVREAQNVASEPRQVSGRLRIGTCESYVISVLPPVFMDMSRLCPRVEISTHTAMVPDLCDMLRQNDVDILFFLDEKIYFPEWVKLWERPEKILFVASADSELAQEKNISIERLLAAPLYLTERGISYRYAMEQVLAARGYELHPFLEVGNTDVITRFLLAGEGISFLPEYVVSEHIKSGRLAALDAEFPEIVMWSQLVYHRNKAVTAQMEMFLDVMSRHAR